MVGRGMKLRWPTLLILGGMLLGGCSLGKVSQPFEDDFEGDCNWPQQESDVYVLDCADGEYHLQSKKDQGQAARIGFKETYSWVRVEADGRASAPDAAFGIGCWTSDGKHGYVFGVGRDGSWVIIKDEAGESLEALESGGSDAIDVVEGSNRLRADCAILPSQAKLRFVVNGVEVAVAHDAEPVSSFGSFGFDVVLGTDAYFDNAAARELDADEALALENAEEGVAGGALAPVESPETLYEEDFSQAADSWPDDKDAGFVDGRYRLRTPRDDSVLVITQDLPLSAARVRIDVDTVQDSPGTGQEHGVSCLSNGTTGYSFALQPDERAWRISRIGPTSAEELRAAAEVPAIRKPPGRNHLRALCEVADGQA
jgi:hypothetical protein